MQVPLGVREEQGLQGKVGGQLSGSQLSQEPPGRSPGSRAGSSHGAETPHARGLDTSSANCQQPWAGGAQLAAEVPSISQITVAEQILLLPVMGLASRYLESPTPSVWPPLPREGFPCTTLALSQQLLHGISSFPFSQEVRAAENKDQGAPRKEKIKYTASLVLDLNL